MAIKFEYGKPGVVPTKYQITQNDIVINTADEVVYFKDRSGEIRSIGNGTNCMPYDDSNVLFRDDANREVTPANKLATMDDISTGGDDDVMLKNVYDTNDNGIVDNSEKVNGLTVETAVPVNAVFTDTTYTDAEIKTKYENNADTNVFSDTEKSKLADIDTSLYEEKANKGVANGYAELDSSGLVPSSQIPAGIDAVQEYDSFADLPASGEHNIIYVTLDNNKTWRWSGTQYVEISASLALGETSSAAYRGDRGKMAYDHSQSAHAPVDAEKNVQSDWDVTDANSDAFILNKPTIGGTDLSTAYTAAKVTISSSTGADTDIDAASSTTAGVMTTTAFDNLVLAYNHSQSAHAPSDAEKNVQSDWDETSTSSDAFIVNKIPIKNDTYGMRTDTDLIFDNSGTDSPAIIFEDNVNDTHAGMDIKDEVYRFLVDYRNTGWQYVFSVNIQTNVADFTNIPTIPTTTPTVAGQVASKKYVDDSILANGTDLTTAYSSTGVTIESSTGSDTDISYATSSQAGVISTAQYGNLVTAYNHSQSAHAPSDAEKNVNADWNATAGDAEILNKPGIVEYLNIEDYGAVGNDSTDSTTAIQDAIDDAIAQNKVVLIPSGTFRFTNLTANGSLNMVGLGVTSVLKKMSGTDNGLALIGSPSYHAKLSNFAIIAGISQTSGSLIYIGETNQSGFDNLFLDGGYYGIYAYETSQSAFRWVRVQNCEVNGMYFADCLDMYVDNCRSDNNADYGLHVNTVSGLYATNVTCYGNTHGFYVENAISSPTVADTNGFHFYANCIGDSSSNHNWLIKSLTRSYFTACWGGSQSVDGQFNGFRFEDCQSITMAGGTALNNRGDGIYTDSSCDGIGIVGMNINGNGVGSSGGYGVNMNGDHISVTSNIFTGNGSGNIYGGNTTSTIYANTPDDTSIIGTATNYGIKYPDGSLVCVLVGQNLSYTSASDFDYTWTLPGETKDTNYAVNSTHVDTIPFHTGTDTTYSGDVILREKDKQTTSVRLNAWLPGVWQSDGTCKVSATLHGRWR